MNRFITAALASAVLDSVSLAVLQAAETVRSASKPNIVLILADDLGINDLGCYGRNDHHTPNLDRLASQGMRFTCAYTAQPICSPSRAAIMTGKCPARLNLTNYLPGRPDAPSQRLLQPRIEGQLPLEEVTIAELLKHAGYATGLFGKWHLGGPGFGPKEQGFDVALCRRRPTPTPTPETGGKGEFAITAAAEKFIEDHRDQPFFCYVPHNNPHIPLAAAPELVEKHRDAFNPVYAAMIETLDDAVGRLMAKVESLGLADRTIFIFTSDNGGLHVLESPGTPATHNTPFRAGKGLSLRRWPARAADRPLARRGRGRQHVRNAGRAHRSRSRRCWKRPASIRRKRSARWMALSIVKLLRGESLPPRTLYWHFPNYTNQGGRPAGAIRDGDWKLVEHFEDGSVELFNLAHDPGETKNLAASEPARADELRDKLHAWRAERRGADADAESRIRRGAASAAVRRTRSVAACRPSRPPPPRRRNGRRGGRR